MQQVAKHFLSTVFEHKATKPMFYKRLLVPVCLTPLVPRLASLSKKDMLCHWRLHHNITAILVFIGGLLGFPIARCFGQVNIGPLYCRWHDSTSETTNVDVCGPLLFYAKAAGAQQFCLRPIVAFVNDRKAESTEVDVLYPLFTYDRRGNEYKWQLLQLVSGSGGTGLVGTNFCRVTLFPILFVQHSGEPSESYIALFPVGGTLKNRFFRDEIKFVLWPLYVRTVRAQLSQPTPLIADSVPACQTARKTESKVVTYNFVAPIFHLRRGNGLKGWQFWPLIGHEHKTVTSYTNLWGEEESVPAHDTRFFLWPVYLQQTRNIGTTNAEHHFALLPFYVRFHSLTRDSTSYLWPIGVTITQDRKLKYREIGVPWPLIVFASGEGKNTKRIFPLFSHAWSATAESEWYLWPVYKRTRLNAHPLERDRTRILFFLFSDTIERNTQAGVSQRRTTFWPLFNATRSYDGVERVQLFSLLEPILPNNTGIERNYSALWAIWRSEKNPVAGVTNRSFLWNLYRCDANAVSRRSSFLFGIFRYEATQTGKRLRLFYIPLSRKPKPSVQSCRPSPDSTTSALAGERSCARF